MGAVFFLKERACLTDFRGDFSTSFSNDSLLTKTSLSLSDVGGTGLGGDGVLDKLFWFPFAPGPTSESKKGEITYQDWI